MIQVSSHNKEFFESDTWNSIKKSLQEEYGMATYKNWFVNLDLVEVGTSEVMLSAPTKFIKEWVVNNYAKRIKELFQKEIPAIKSLDIIVKKGKQNTTDQIIIAGGVDVTGQNIDLFNYSEQNNVSLGSPLDRRFTFENFVVADSNKLAYSAAMSVANTDNSIAGLNPFFIYGGVGLGKTHLLHAIALKIKENNPSTNVVYLSAERFMYQFINALRNKDIISFKEFFRSIDVLLLDDIQFVCGKSSTQEEFLHTLNALTDLNKKVIVSGNKSPSDMEGMNESIRSRLGWGLVVDIGSPCFQLRRGILASKVSQMKNIEVPDEVLDFVATKITSNTRELEGALNKVVASSSLMNEEISLDGTKKILSDLLRANEKAITILDIQKIVADYFDIKVADMSSAQRSRRIARPRQVAMYMAKNLTPRSLAEIGRKFGGKDHTTVMHAVKRVDELINSDNEFKNDIECLNRMLGQ